MQRRCSAPRWLCWRVTTEGLPDSPQPNPSPPGPVQ
jgi:hypothetical protein